MAEKRVDLGWAPRKWQVECHFARRRFSVYALHRRAGKTEMAVIELLLAAMQAKLQNTLFVYLAPWLKQAKQIAWDRLKHFSRKVPGTTVSESELFVQLVNGSKVQVFGGDNPDGMRGLRLDGVVLDEVAQMKPEVWNEIVQPALSDRKGWALFIGTPKGVNLFSELWHRASTLPDWHSAVYTVYDTDALDPDEVERLRRDMPENEWKREYLCDFSAAAEDQLLSIADAEAAAHREVRPHEVQHAPVVIGVDVARFGDDASVISIRQGLVAREPIVLRGVDNMAFASRVAQAIVDTKADAVFVDVGQGSGVIDRLRQLGHSVIEVNFGGKAMSPEFSDKRSEMWCLMADWVMGGGCIPNNTDLKRDLATPTYSFDGQNRKRLESKDQIKKRLLRSPDLGDALALTFAMPVAPRAGDRNARSRVSILPDYDPFALALR